MKRSYPALAFAAVLLIFGPVAWRVLSWERSRPLAVDSNLAKAGEVLFMHEWQVNDPLCPNGDGLGPVFNAKSCVACHHQGGPGGGGGLDNNVTTFHVVKDDGATPEREGIIHSFAIDDEHLETLKHVHPALPAVSRPPLSDILGVAGRGRGDVLVVEGRLAALLPNNVRLSQRNTPALFGIGLLDLIPDQAIIANERQQRLRFGMASGGTDKLPIGRVHRLADGRIGRFGWKAQTANLADFVQAACASELGLGNPAQTQPTSLAQLNYKPRGLDLTQMQCDEITAFVAGLPRPKEQASPETAARAHAGKAVFNKVGCADCHTPNLGQVQGVYSDLLLHRMGQDLQGNSNSYGAQPTPTTPRTSSDPTGPLADEWRTPPLWGVANSAPYMHDGRAPTLEDAITMHGGQATGSAERFAQLSIAEKEQLIVFLRSLQAP
ncbi:MAG TPA: di-heme oxidoredictase family protein [Gemmataceae bacterium]|nr:di-heme oxidoredictase family protein [Gemmataceae bacterium]